MRAAMAVFLVLVRVLAALGEVADELLVGQPTHVPAGELQPFGQAAIAGHDLQSLSSRTTPCSMFSRIDSELALPQAWRSAAQLGQVVADPDIALERAVRGEQGVPLILTGRDTPLASMSVTSKSR